MNSYSTKLFIRKNDNNDNNEKIVELNTKLPGEEYTIGWVEGCDIQLSNDTGYMSKCHCVLKKEVFGWTVRDTSTNGTKLLQDNRMIEVQRSKEPLHNHNILLVEDWHLTFIDPTQTPPIPSKLQKCPWVFNVSEEVLYKVENGNRIKVRTSPQIKKMLHYMASKNIAHNNVPKVCSHDELIKAIWGKDHFGITRHHLSLLTRKVRNILASNLEKNNKEERQKWLETFNNEGYVLKIDCEA